MPKYKHKTPHVLDLALQQWKVSCYFENHNLREAWELHQRRVRVEAARLRSAKSHILLGLRLDLVSFDELTLIMQVSEVFWKSMMLILRKLAFKNARKMTTVTAFSRTRQQRSLSKHRWVGNLNFLNWFVMKILWRGSGFMKKMT